MSKTSFAFGLCVFIFLSAASVAVGKIDTTRPGGLSPDADNLCLPSNKHTFKVGDSSGTTENGNAMFNATTGKWSIVTTAGAIEHPGNYFGQTGSASIEDASISIKNPKPHELPNSQVAEVSAEKTLNAINLRPMPQIGSIWVKESIDARLGFSASFTMETLNYECAAQTEIEINEAIQEQPTQYDLSVEANELLEAYYCNNDPTCKVKALIACRQYGKQPLGPLNCDIDYDFKYDSTTGGNSSYSYIDKCGPDGMAFVVMPQGNKDIIGEGGAGLGYLENVHKALIVEFDNKVEALSMMETRHIAVTVHRKSSTNIEFDENLLAWTTTPPNWNPADFTAITDSSQNNGKWTVTFYNGMIEIKFERDGSSTFPIQWIPQTPSSTEVASLRDEYGECQEYDKKSSKDNCLNTWLQRKISKKFALPSATLNTDPFYQVGFTASSGPYGAGEIRVSDIEVTEFMPECKVTSNTIATVNSYGEAITPVSGEQFELIVAIRDSCGNLVWIDDIEKFSPSDLTRIDVGLTEDTPDGSDPVCSFGSVQLNNLAVEGQFKYTTVCNAVRSINIDIDWYQCDTMKAVINVVSSTEESTRRMLEGVGSAHRILQSSDKKANIEWGQTNPSDKKQGYGDVDNNVVFAIVGDPSLGALTPPTIQITWPNNNYNQRNIQVKRSSRNGLNVWNYRITSTDVGTYIVESALLDQKYSFYMDVGQPYFQYSQLSPVPKGGKLANGWTRPVDGIDAGTSIDVLMLLADKAGNMIDPNKRKIDTSKISLQLKVVNDIGTNNNGKVMALKSSYVRDDGLISFPAQITVAGLQVFIGFVDGRPVSCSYCSKLNVVATDADRSNSVIWLANRWGVFYNTELTEFGGLPQDRSDYMRLWVRPRDKYGNYVDIKDENYKLTVSGYNLEYDGKKETCAYRGNQNRRQGIVFTPCSTSTKDRLKLNHHLYFRLVYRPQYTLELTVSDDNGSTLGAQNFTLSINRKYNEREIDKDADNGPLSLEKSTFTANGTMVAGRWNNNFLVLRTVSGARYNVPLNPWWGSTPSVRSSLSIDRSFRRAHHHSGYNWWWLSLYTPLSQDHIRGQESRQFYVPADVNWLWTYRAEIRVDGPKKHDISITKRVVPNWINFGYIMSSGIEAGFWGDSYCRTHYWCWYAGFCVKDKAVEENTKHQIKFLDYYNNPAKYTQTGSYHAWPTYFERWDGRVWRPVYPKPAHYQAQHCSASTCSADDYSSTYNLVKLNYPLRSAYTNYHKGFVFYNCYRHGGYCARTHGRIPHYYKIYNHPGRPHSSTSRTHLVNSGRSYTWAGYKIGFNFVLRDTWWNLCPPNFYTRTSYYPSRYKNLNITAYLQQPVGKSPTAKINQTPTKAVSIANSWWYHSYYLYIRNIQVTQWGLNQFWLVLDGQKVPGNNWVWVYNIGAVWENGDIWNMNDGKWVYMDPSKTPTIQNYNSYPLFYMRQKDKYHNYLHGFQSGWTHLNAYVYDMQRLRDLQYYPPTRQGVTGSLILQFISRIYKSGQLYYLDDSYYWPGSQNQTNLFTYPNGNYQIVFSSRWYGGRYYQILRNIVLYGEGSADAQYDTNVDAALNLANTAISANSFNVTAGQWGRIDLTFKTVNNKVAKFKYVNIYNYGLTIDQVSKTNPNDSDKREDTVKLRNFKLKNHPTKEGTVILYVRQMRKGDYTYQLKANVNYRKQSSKSYQSIPTQIQVRFNPDTAKYIVWNEESLIRPDQLQLSHQRVDDTNSFNFVAFDQFHNKVETIEDEEKTLQFQITRTQKKANPPPKWNITRPDNFEQRTLHITVEQSGLYQISAVGVKRNHTGVDMTRVAFEKNSWVREWPTYVDASKSSARVNITDLDAGENLGYNVKLYDKFGNLFELVPRPFVGETNPIDLYANSMTCFKYTLARHENTTVGEWFCMDKSDDFRHSTAKQVSSNEIGFTTTMYWAGKCQVAVYFNSSEMIPATLGSGLAKVNINPLAPDFETTNLDIRDSYWQVENMKNNPKVKVDDRYVSYKKPASFEYHIEFTPLLRLSIRDWYGNDVGNLPDDFFTYEYEVNMDNSREAGKQVVAGALKLDLCKTVLESLGAEDRVIQFGLCPAPEEADENEELDPSWQYGNFFPGDFYTVNLKMIKKETNTIYLQKIYNLKMVGIVDETGLITGLPENLSMTGIHETKVITKAGVQAEINFDLIASNGKRRYYWYPRNRDYNSLYEWSFVDVSPSEFPGEVFNTSRGLRRGMQVTTANTTKAFGVNSDPIAVRLTAFSYEVMGKDVLWVNEPVCRTEDGDYDITKLRNIQFRDSKYPDTDIFNTENFYTNLAAGEAQQIPILPEGKVGHKYQVIFSVHDIYNNECKVLSTDEDLDEMVIARVSYLENVKSEDADGNLIEEEIIQDADFTLKLIENTNYFLVSFTPTYSANQTITVNGRAALAFAQPGSADSSESLANVVDNTDGAAGLKASGELEVTIALKDLNGNPVKYLESDLTRLKAYYKLSGGKFWTLFKNITPKPANDGYNLTLTEAMLVQGDYDVMVSMDDITLECASCKLTVIPSGNVDFSKSILYYLSPMSGQWNSFTTESTINVDVGSETPSYQLELADEFGNVYADTDMIENYENATFTCKYEDDPSESIQVISSNINKQITFDTGLTSNGPEFDLSTDLEAWDTPANFASGKALLVFYYTPLGETTAQNVTGHAKFFSEANDGTDTAAFDPSKTMLLIDGKYSKSTKMIGEAGMESTFMIEFKTVNDLRKSDIILNVTVEFDPLPENGENLPIFLNCSAADVAGRFTCGFASNTSYSADAPLSVVISQDGEKLPVKVDAEVGPGELTSAFVYDDYTSYAIVGGKAYFRVGGFDDFGNRAVFQGGDPGTVVEMQSNTNSSEPAPEPEASSSSDASDGPGSSNVPSSSSSANGFSDTTDMAVVIAESNPPGLSSSINKDGDYAYTYSTHTAGIHAIKGNEFERVYVYMDSAPIDPISSEFQIINQNISAGQSVEFLIFGKDEYTNTIKKDYLVGNKTLFDVTLTLENGTKITFPGKDLETAPITTGYVDALYGQIQVNASGTHKISPTGRNDASSPGLTLSCDECELIVSPNDFEITKVKVALPDLDGQGVTPDDSIPASRRRRLQITYDTVLAVGDDEDLSLTVSLTDTYGNLLESVPENALFTAVVFGNGILEAEPITLVTEYSNETNQVKILSNASEEYLALVPLEGYTVTMTYYVGSIDPNFIQGEVSIGLTIEGENPGYSNGPLSIPSTQVDPQFLEFTAYEGVTTDVGASETFTIILKTEEQGSPMYFGDFNSSRLSINSPSGVACTLDAELEVPGVFYVAVESTVANYDTDTYTIDVYIDGSKVGKSVSVRVNPGLPMINETIIEKQWSEDYLLINQIYSLHITVYDQFKNIIQPTKEIIDLLGANFLGNNGDLSQVSFTSGNTFVMNFQANFPIPNTLEMQVTWAIDNFTQVTISDPISYPIYTRLDSAKTDLYGEYLFGTSVDNIFSHYALPKDVYGLCYTRSVKVNAKIRGPFKSNNPSDESPYTSQDTITEYTGVVTETNYTSSGSNDDAVQALNDLSACQYVYDINYGTYDDYRPVRMGWWEVSVQVIGAEDDKDVSNSAWVTERVTFLDHGDLSINSSQISMLGAPKGRGRDSLYLSASQIYYWLFVGYDRFDNRYNPKISPYTMTIENTDNVTHKIGKLSYGVYSISSTFMLIGEYNAFPITMTASGNEQVSDYLHINKVDAPDSIVVSPGVCSSVFPSIDTTGLEATENSNGNTVVTIGKQLSIELNCFDMYGNNVPTGGESEAISVFIRATELPNIGTDYVDNSITDNSDGTYTVTFIPAWPGKYYITALLEGIQYGAPVEFIGVNSVCTDSANPILCPDGETCASTYQECEITELPEECASETPISCPVAGVDTCVSAGIYCDCPSGFSKCSDYKCVPDALVTALCPYYTVHVDQVLCPPDYPTYCPTTGGCRLETDDCPNQPVCPPGYDLCPDLSCASQLDGGCTYDDYEACPSLKYKCPDGSCETRPENCATQVTCLNEDDYLCATNNVCVSSPLECAQPNACPVDGQVRCPRDNSCVNDIDSCPKGVVCTQTGYSLCENEECSADCRATEDITADEAIDVFFRRRALSHRRALTDEAEFLQPMTSGVYCPSGEVANTLYNCAALPTCGTNAIRCPDGSCSETADQCTQPACPTGSAKCWDGRCVTGPDECSTRPVCPETLPVKCADGTCVGDQSSCGVIECPPSKPYRCGSGECATSNEQCSTQSICPAEKPIKCADSSCVKAPYHCNTVSSGYHCADNYMMCPDGSCARSLSLCPSFKTCQTNQYMCIDGSCVAAVEQCNDVSNFAQIDAIPQLPIRCPSGEFRAELTDCPTQLICPDGKVMCGDGNCRDSKDLCYTEDQCEFGLKKCPDGSCTSNICPSTVTCTLDSPYKCYDQTCRRDPRDCPEMPTCPDDQPILCGGSGQCVTHRYKCVPELPSCSASNPVLCPSLVCAKHVDSCITIENCPTGKIRCATGECMNDMSECRDATCPLNLPNKCFNGICVEDPQHCDDATSGCPFDSPFRCPNGLCVPTNDTCSTQINECGTDSGKIACPDGSCYPSDIQCPNEQGCLNDEVMCANGVCGSECPISSCPAGTVKCLSGLCVDSFASCPDIFSADDYTRCSQNVDGRMVPCADGKCVSSADECKALSQCNKGYVRCDDGQCRRFDELCPRLPSTSVCPANRPTMCDNGMCTTTAEECILSNGCPSSKSYKCKDTGLCVSDSENCKDLTSMSSCPSSTPYLCADGTCTDKLTSCPLNTCPFSAPYMCLDGSCSTSFSECLAKGPACSDEKVLCPDELTCKDNFEDCLATNGCPVTKPFKCGSNAGCVGDPEECNAAVICPSYQPFLCTSGECAGDPNLCSSTQNVTDMTMTICPSTTPMLCPNGKCVSSLDSCGEVTKTCPDAQPFLCTAGNCATYPYECALETLDYIEGRVLQTSNMTIDQGCSETYPSRCYDGSCRINADSCPIFPGCTNPVKPFLCSSGACAVTQADCLAQVSNECDAGQAMCIDGMCREDCSILKYNGCAHDELLCSNGRCVESLAECAGTSACEDIEAPFRCVDGTCVKELTDCENPFRYFISEEFQVTLTPTSTKKLSFMVDNKMSQAQLNIPSGALLTPTTALLPPIETPKEMTFSVKPVAWSQLGQLANPIHSAMIQITSEMFPLTDGNLDNKNYDFIRSPILNITSSGRAYPETDYRYPVQYTVKVDDLTNDNFDPYNMMCLGKREEVTQSWECASRKVTYDSVNHKYTFSLPSDGVYAVIFNPRPPAEEPSSATCQGYICQYIAALGVTGFVTLIFIGCLGYIFSRLYRYMMKYRNTKKTMSNYDEVINEMMSMTTENIGMSLRDKIEGITFTKNLMYRNRPDEEVEISKLKDILSRIEGERAALDSERKDIVSKNKFFAKEIEILRNELDRRRAEGSIDASGEMEAVQHEFAADSN